MTAMVADWLQEGVAHHGAGRLADAIARYRQVLTAEPDNPDALNLLGVASAQQGRATEAVSLIRRAVELRPAVADFHANLGNVLKALGRRAEAVEAYMAAARLDPHEAGVWIRLGRLQRDLGDLFGAADSLSRAAALAPRDIVLGVESADLEREVRGLLDRHTVVRPCRHGDLRFLPHDRYVGRALDLYGELSPEEGRLLADLVRPGDTVLEAGANIGSHTVAMARAVGPGGRLIAWEPQGLLHRVLADNLARNGLTWAEARHGAVGEAAGVLAVPRMDYANPDNFGGVSLEETGGDPVPVERIDDLELPRLDLIKADVEGMEAAVLRGAAATIARCRPLLYVENDRVDRSSELIRTIRAMGYRLWWHLPTLFGPENFRANPENVFGSTASANMLCLPEEVRMEGWLEPVLSDEDTGYAALARIRAAKAGAPAAPAAPASVAPTGPEAVAELINQGDSLRRAGRPSEAEQLLRQVLRMAPMALPALLSLAASLTDLGKAEEALELVRRAASLRPDSPQAQRDLGNMLRLHGETDGALAAFRAALALAPEDPDARLGESLCLLKLGRYREGFQSYGARWTAAKHPPRHGGLPPWQGEPGRRVLVWHEQGHGDTLQCLRFLPQVAALSTGVVAEVPASMLELARRSPVAVSGVSFVAIGSETGPVDAQVPFMELTGLLGVEPATAPWTGPYLASPPSNRPPGDRPRVGLVWRGNPDFPDDPWRSPGLSAMAPLLEVPGIDWVGLQAGKGRDELRGVPLPAGFQDAGAMAANWSDTAAVMAGLDLVVTSCTAPAHLAGALGVPVWVLLSTCSDWRWHQAGETSPWYPTVRLFRQERLGRWEAPVRAVVEALREMAGG